MDFSSLFSLKATDKSSCSIHPPPVQDRATQGPTGIQPHWLALSLPAVPMWVRQWNGMQTVVTRLKKSGQWTSSLITLTLTPFSPGTHSSVCSSNAPSPLISALAVPSTQTHSPLICLSLVSSQPAGSRWNDTLSQWALLTSLLSNFHPTLRHSLSHHPCAFSS